MLFRSSTDIVGDKVGRIHLGKQDLMELQTRKMKGLKRTRDSLIVDAEDIEMKEEEQVKKSKKVNV